MQEHKIYQMVLSDVDSYLVSFISEIEEGTAASLLFCVKLSSLAEIYKPDTKIVFPFFIKGTGTVNLEGIRRKNTIRFKPPKCSYGVDFTINDDKRYTYKANRTIRMVELEPVDVETMDELFLRTGGWFAGYTSL